MGTVTWPKCECTYTIINLNVNLNLKKSYTYIMSTINIDYIVYNKWITIEQYRLKLSTIKLLKYEPKG